MTTLNIKKPQAKTFEGAVGTVPNAEKQLRRAVMSCLLWEKSFYESGEDIADRIDKLAPHVNKAPEIAVEARKKLRHVPLLICASLAKAGKLKKETLHAVIQRPDELSEFLSIYWKDGKCPLSAQVKKGLALAFSNFNEFQFTKYTGARENGKQVKIKDVLKLSHANLGDLGKKILNDDFKEIDTWETKVKTNSQNEWETLLDNNSLPAMALLRNLRNMQNCGVGKSKIVKAFQTANISRVLPFRFISAAKHAPSMEPEIEGLMFKSVEERPKLKGKTVLLVDVSASMYYEKVSQKSELSCFDAAAGLAILSREVCEDVYIYSFSNQIVHVPARRGFALRDAIDNSQSHGGTALGASINMVCEKVKFDRLIVITDEQSQDKVSAPKGTYIINVASYKTGIEYRKAVHINGWSESIIDYILENEH